MRQKWGYFSSRNSALPLTKRYELISLPAPAIHSRPLVWLTHIRVHAVDYAKAEMQPRIVYGIKLAWLMTSCACRLSPKPESFLRGSGFTPRDEMPWLRPRPFAPKQLT
ncbi:MAG: hypothetical protein EXQ52_10610 [Bryobacterales bacterium]|nr:hypothetical protein [Bryobacterales bacterium]